MEIEDSLWLSESKGEAGTPPGGDPRFAPHRLAHRTDALRACRLRAATLVRVDKRPIAKSYLGKMEIHVGSLGQAASKTISIFAPVPPAKRIEMGATGGSTRTFAVFLKNLVRFWGIKLTLEGTIKSAIMPLGGK